MGLEGHIEIALRRHDDRIAAAAVVSRRPQIAARFLQGQSAAQALARVPLIFSVCARAQEAAAQAAVEAATGVAPAAELTTLRTRRVLAESVHEALWRIFADWPEWLGEPRDAGGLKAMRGLLLPLIKGTAVDAMAAQGAAAAGAELLAATVFGEPAAVWQARLAEARIDAWCAAAATPAARFIAAAFAADAGGAAPGRLRPLPSLPAAACAAELAAALAADDFAERPLWQGRPAETGPAARSADRLAALAAARGSGLGLRLVARLDDAVQLLRRLGGAAAADDLPVVAAARGADGSGWGVVETARGRLIHVVGLDDETVVRYRIVAPTEWNFHPQGALPGLVIGLPAADRAAAEKIAALAVQALDPCVAHRVEVVDA